MNDDMNHDQNRQIQWPAILIQEEQTELVYLESEQAMWVETLAHLDEYTLLLDRNGVTYELTPAPHTQLKPDTQLSWQVSDEPLCLPRILALIRQHASVLGHCCTAKMGSESIEHFFQIMKFLEEN